MMKHASTPTNSAIPAGAGTRKSSKSSVYQAAANAIAVPKLSQHGTYRLHLSHMGIDDSVAQEYFQCARDRLVAAFATTQQGAQMAEALGHTPTFKDVPLVEVTLNRNGLGDAGFVHALAFLTGNPNVTAVELLSNQLTDASAPAIAELVRNTKIARMKVGDNSFTGAGIEVICAALQEGNSRLIQCHLSGNNLGDVGMTAIAASVATSHLEVLGLREVGIAEDGWAAVGAMLCNPLGALREVQLKGNDMTPEAAQKFAAPLIARWSNPTSGPIRLPPLRVLSLSQCSIDAPTMAALCSALHGCANLLSLDLSNNAFGDEGGVRLAKFILNETAAQLTTLNLSKTGITELTLEALVCGSSNDSVSSAPQQPATMLALPPMGGADADASNPSHSRSSSGGFSGNSGNSTPGRPLAELTSLDISMNSFAAPSAGNVLRTLIESIPSLASLSAHHCNLRSAAMGGIFSALERHPKLRDLELSANFCRDGNTDLISRIVRSSTVLSRLILTDNEISSPSIETIVTALKTSAHRNIAFLQVGGQSTEPPCKNEVSQSAQMMLSAALTRNRVEHDGKHGKNRTKNAHQLMQHKAILEGAATAAGGKVEHSHQPQQHRAGPPTPERHPNMPPQAISAVTSQVLPPSIILNPTPMPLHGTPPQSMASPNVGLPGAPVSAVAPPPPFSPMQALGPAGPMPTRINAPGFSHQQIQQTNATPLMVVGHNEQTAANLPFGAEPQQKLDTPMVTLLPQQQQQPQGQQQPQVLVLTPQQIADLQSNGIQVLSTGAPISGLQQQQSLPAAHVAPQFVQHVQQQQVQPAFAQQQPPHLPPQTLARPYFGQ